MPNREPVYKYDGVSNRFRAADGRFVPAKTVRAVMDKTLASGAQATRSLTEGLASGNLSLGQWRAAMAAEVKASQIAATVLAKGGLAQMTPADWGWTGQRIREQYRRLGDFAGQIGSGRQPLNGTALRRAEMYAEAARAANREMERRMARLSNQEEERNILGDADHCPGCLEAASEGWQPIGSLVPIGSRDCLTLCKCALEFRTVSRGQEAA